MKKTIVIILSLMIMSASCGSKSVEKTTKTEGVVTENVTPDSGENILDETHEVKNEMELSDGISIKWFEHGEGDKLVYGDMVAINYKVLLKNGEMIDGNELNGKASVPFMVGFGMQTKGWDIALENLRVGDFVEVFIPSKMARGESSVEGLFPANSDNILKIRIVKLMKPTRNVDGNKVWIFEENETEKTLFNEDNEISFHTMAFTPSNPVFINTYRTKKPFKLKLADSGLVPGLKKALINAKKGDRMFIFVPSSEAYKSKGYLDVVKPNEDLLYNVLVLNVVNE